MCNPALLIVASTAVTAMDRLQSGLYASKVARNQAAVAKANKGMARENAIDAIGLGQDEQRRLGREVAQRVGSQEARLGANNVDITFGSAARTIDDTKLVGKEDSEVIAENTRRQVRAMQIDVWGYEAERRARLSEAKQAKVATAFSVASTALGGATQYAKFKAGQK